VDGQKRGKRIGSANSRMDENADNERMAERITSIEISLKSWGQELQNEYRVD